MLIEELLYLGQEAAPPLTYLGAKAETDRDRRGLEDLGSEGSSHIKSWGPCSSLFALPTTLTPFI